MSAAEPLANAAGGRGVWRRRWVGFPVIDVRRQGSLAEARQPFARMRSPFWTGIKRNEMTKDPGTCQEHSTASDVTPQERHPDGLYIFSLHNAWHLP